MTSISSALPPMTGLSPTMAGDDFNSLRGTEPKELAQQFEGLFVSMLVKEMRQSSSGGEGMFPGDNSDTYGGLFDMYLGQHIAENGGIGLAESIQASIAKQSPA